MSPRTQLRPWGGLLLLLRGSLSSAATQVGPPSKQAPVQKGSGDLGLSVHPMPSGLAQGAWKPAPLKPLIMGTRFRVCFTPTSAGIVRQEVITDPHSRTLYPTHGTGPQVKAGTHRCIGDHGDVELRADAPSGPTELRLHLTNAQGREEGIWSVHFEAANP